MINISFHPKPVPPGARFSIILPTWNNLPYLKQCLESLEKIPATNIRSSFMSTKAVTALSAGCNPGI